MTLFARIADLVGVACRLRELVPSVVLDGPDHNWRSAVVTFGKWWNRRTLTLTHDPEYYAEPNWSTQMSGMRRYFAGFPDTERKQWAIGLTTSFRFSLGILFNPDASSQGDPRVDILFAIVGLLDGVLFTPTALRDAHGRILFGAGGEDEEDPEAVWPRVLGEVPVSDPLGAAMHEKSRPKPPSEENAGGEPPTAERVARRALALVAVTTRAILEQEGVNANTRATHKQSLAWIGELRLDEELEPDEWKVVQRPPGRLDSRSQIDSTWRLEGLVVLAWALGQFDLPSHDQLVQPNPLWDSLGWLDTRASRALLAEPMLRSREEIGMLRNRLFALHWRVRNYELHPMVMDFAAFARTCWFGPLELSGVPLLEGDLALRGQRIDRARAEVFGQARSAAQERHQAANWLWEGPARYSEASTST